MVECVRIGRATLYRDDCRYVVPHLPPIDALICDPPYGLDFAAQPTMYARKRGQPRNTWDNETFQGMPWLLEACKAPVQIIWGGNYYALPLSRGWLCWHKPDGPPSFARFELAWTSQDKLPGFFTQSISATNAERVGHPTQKPLNLMEWCIDYCDNNPQVILDPFMGSGTTGVAAVRMGRNFIGVESNAEYFDMACKRIEQAQKQQDMFMPPPLIENLPLPLK